MAIAFPTNPSLNQTYEYDGSRYINQSTGWKLAGGLLEQSQLAKLSDVRIGISPTLIHPDAILSSTKLYVHRFRGEYISLYSSSKGKWDIYQLPLTPQDFTVTTIVPDRLHDVYLYLNSAGSWSVEFLAWQDNLTAPTRGIQDGVEVRLNALNRKFIGVILTSETQQNQIQNRYGAVALTKLNAVEQSPRMGFLNRYNQLPTSYFLKFAEAFGEDTLTLWKFPTGYGQNAGITVLNLDQQFATCSFGLQVPAAVTGDVSVSMGLGSTTPAAAASIIYRKGGVEFQGRGNYNAQVSPIGATRLYYLFNSASAGQINTVSGVSGLVARVNQ